MFSCGVLLKTPALARDLASLVLNQLPIFTHHFYVIYRQCFTRSYLPLLLALVNDNIATTITTTIILVTIIITVITNLPCLKDTANSVQTTEPFGHNDPSPLDQCTTASRVALFTIVYILPCLHHATCQTSVQPTLVLRPSLKLAH